MPSLAATPLMRTLSSTTWPSPGHDGPPTPPPALPIAGAHGQEADWRRAPCSSQTMPLPRPAHALADVRAGHRGSGHPHPLGAPAQLRGHHGDRVRWTRRTADHAPRPGPKPGPVRGRYAARGAQSGRRRRRAQRTGLSAVRRTDPWAVGSDLGCPAPCTPSTGPTRSWSPSARAYLQRDIGAGQSLADRAAVLGILCDLGELLRSDAVGRAADRQRDAADPEAARRVWAEGDVCADVEGLLTAARLAQLSRKLHRKACRVGCGNKLLRDSRATGLVRRPLREANLVAAGAGTAQRHHATSVLKSASPCRTGAAGGHCSSSLPHAGPPGPLDLACHHRRSVPCSLLPAPVAIFFAGRLYPTWPFRYWRPNPTIPAPVGDPDCGSTCEPTGGLPWCVGGGETDCTLWIPQTAAASLAGPGTWLLVGIMPAGTGRRAARGRTSPRFLALASRAVSGCSPKVDSISLSVEVCSNGP